MVPYLECGTDELTHIKVMILATVEMPHCHAIPKLGRFPINWNHLIEKEFAQNQIVGAGPCYWLFRDLP